jgi:hypothetical protein
VRPQISPQKLKPPNFPPTLKPPDFVSLSLSLSLSLSSRPSSSGVFLIFLASCHFVKQISPVYKLFFRWFLYLRQPFGGVLCLRRRIPSPARSVCTLSLSSPIFDMLFFFASVCNMGIKMYIKFSLYTHSSKHTVVCCGCKSNLLLVLWMILLDSTIFKHLKC